MGSTIRAAGLQRSLSVPPASLPGARPSSVLHCTGIQSRLQPCRSLPASAELEPAPQARPSPSPDCRPRPAPAPASSAGQQVIRWPSECQVLPFRIRHIKSLPSSPEIFYDPTGKEPQPRPVGEEHGSVVYNYRPASQVNYFSRSVSAAGACELQSGVRPAPDPASLSFESRFESGNLERAVRITETYYELQLRPDLYTGRHCQWFYFQIQNMRTDVRYRLSIVNFTKPDSLYTCGMKPVLYSKTEADRHFVGWTRVGDNIRYYRNEERGGEEEEEGPSYTLTFTLSFPHAGDTVYLAHCYPYRYSDLTEDLLAIQTSPARARFCSQRLLCRTLAGNNVPVLTVSTPDCLEETRGKICVVLSARVHPGETPSSWMMRGVIEFLTGPSETAAALRDRFVFKIVPMLNPDGVIVGNTRCNLAGRDLNRQYKNVIKEAFPPVYQTKMMIKKLMEEGSIAMYCDFHAHSRKFNIFMYGCENRRHSDKYLKEQIFPLMLHKNASDKFSFEGCKFTIQRSKETTGRVVFWNMGILNSFTLEASYGGSNLGSRAFTHFTTGDYQALGRYYCETLQDFLDSDPPNTELRSKILQKLIKEESSAVEPVNVALSDYSSLSSSGGSDAELDQAGDSVTLARKSLTKRRRKKSRARHDFYSTNYCEYLRPENYTVAAQEGGGLRAGVESDATPSPTPLTPRNTPAPAPAQPAVTDLVLDFNTLGLDSGESTSTDGDSDYLNLVFQDGPASANHTDSPTEDVQFQGQEVKEFSALSCERVHSEILASVNKIRSSIIKNRKNFLPSCQKLSVEGNGMQTTTESPSRPGKTKNNVKRLDKTLSGGGDNSATLKSNKKKRKVPKSSKNTPTNGLRKKEVDSKSDLSSTTPLRAKTFYKKAGNITKLEVFLHHDTKKKKKKLDSDVRKGSAMKESGSGLS